MNILPFPPVILTHITKDNALFHGACKSGLDKLIDTHNLTHLTAISVSTFLLNSNQLTHTEICWIKSIAGLNINPEENRNKYGNGIEIGYTDGDGNGHGYGYTDGDGHGHGHGTGNGNGDGYGYGCGREYEDGYGNGYGRGYKRGYGDVYGEGNGYGYGN